jgi:hypothetical protein
MQLVRPVLMTLALAALAVPAVAQDENPEGPGPALDAKAPEKKPERKVDEAAAARLKAWGKAMHLPTQTAADRIVASAGATNQSMFQGGELTVKTSWDRQEGLSLDVTLPKEMTDTMPPQAAEMAKGLFSTWAREALAPAFEAPSQYARHYHVGQRTKGEEQIVELLPFSDEAAAEMQLLHFDENGLCERRVMIPKVDPNDPSQQMMMGVEIETTFTYEKPDRRHEEGR